MEAQEKPASRADEAAQRINREAVLSFGKVMEKMVDRVMEKMMEKVMDRMADKWRLENKGRIEQAVVETMNENIGRLTGDGGRSEQETGKRMEELVDKVVNEVALLIDKMMQQVERKLDKAERRQEGEEAGGGGEGEEEAGEESSSDGSVCEMPPPGHRQEDECEEEEGAEEEDILEEPPLTPNQREAFHEVFLQFSQSTNEVIDLSSLRTSLADIEIPMAEADVYSILEALDSDGDGEATFEDFLRLVTSTRLFFLFFRELPDRCEGSVPQTGAVDNTIFFEILSRFIQTQMLSEDTTRKIIRYYYRKKKGARLKSKKPDTKKQILPPPMFLGQTIYSLATYVDILEPDEEYQDVPLDEEQVKAFREIFDMFSLDKQDCIDINSLLNVMAEVQIYLKNPLIPNEMKCVEVNLGKEVSFEDFLAIMTDTKTFGQYLSPVYEECKSTVATPVVMFQAINKLVSSPLLSAKTKGVVAAYYRNKFIAAAQGYGEESESEQVTSPEPVSESAEGKPRSPKPAPPAKRPPPDRPHPCKKPAKGAKGSAKKAHSRKIKEPQISRRQHMHKKFQAALRSPAFLQAFKAYSWTWKEKQEKQRQEGLLCP